MIPDNLLYSREHIWARIEEDRAYIGITDFAQHYMNVIVYIELPELEMKAEAGSQIGLIESIKGVSPIFSPVGGTIIEVNEEVEINTQLLQDDPYSNHIAVILLDNKGDLKNLLSADDYKILCDETELE